MCGRACDALQRLRLAESSETSKRALAGTYTASFNAFDSPRVLKRRRRATERGRARLQRLRLAESSETCACGPRYAYPACFNAFDSPRVLKLLICFWVKLLGSLQRLRLAESSETRSSSWPCFRRSGFNAFDSPRRGALNIIERRWGCAEQNRAPVGVRSAYSAPERAAGALASLAPRRTTATSAFVTRPRAATVGCAWACTPTAPARAQPVMTRSRTRAGCRPGSVVVPALALEPAAVCHPHPPMLPSAARSSTPAGYPGQPPAVPPARRCGCASAPAD